jgi:hypothetical protein
MGVGNRISLLGMALFVGAVVGVTASAAPSPTAPTFYVSPTGSDSGRCAQQAPCATLARAYLMARAGGQVQVAAGSYPRQEIFRDPGQRSAEPTVVKAAPGATVRLAGLTLGGSEANNAPSNLIIESVDVTGASVEIFEGATNVTLKNVDGPNFYIRGARNVRISGGSWGPCLTDGLTRVCGNNKLDGGTPPFVNENITIENATFHDYRIVQGSGAHFECLFLIGGRNVTVRNSRFTNCEFFGIFAQYHGVPLEGLRIEGNQFDAPFNGEGGRRDTAIMFSGGGSQWKNVAIRKNSFVGSSPYLDDGTSGGFDSVTVEDNFGQTPSGCVQGVIYRRNYWLGSGCRTELDRQTVPFGYRLEANGLQLVAAEANSVRRAFAGAVSRVPLKTIVQRLRKSRAQAPRGGWNIATLRTLLADPMYLGNQVGGPGAHPAIVPSRSFRLAKRSLAQTQ